MQIKHDTDLEEVMADPKKFGLPTFEEWKKNPDLLKNQLSVFDSVDNGPQKLLKTQLRRIRYQWRGYYFDKIEHVERAIHSDGVDVNELDYQPEVIPQGGGKLDLLVRIVKKGRKDAASLIEKP